jgi:hypothetical protein
MLRFAALLLSTMNCAATAHAQCSSFCSFLGPKGGQARPVHGHFFHFWERPYVHREQRVHVRQNTEAHALHARPRPTTAERLSLEVRFIRHNMKNEMLFSDELEHA